MSRTYRAQPYHWTNAWHSRYGRGRFLKRLRSKADRACARDLCRQHLAGEDPVIHDRTLSHASSEVDWRGH